MRKAADHLTCTTSSTTLRLELTKKERTTFLDQVLALLKEAAKPPQTSTQVQSTHLWDDTNLQWATIRNREAITHLKEMTDRDSKAATFIKFLENLFISYVGLGLFITLLLLAGTLLFVNWLEPFYLPRLDLAMAVTIADTMYDHYNPPNQSGDGTAEEQGTTELPSTPKTPRAWSHEAFAPGLLREVVMDRRFMEIVREVDAEIKGLQDFNGDIGEFYLRLAKNRKFRYLLLSVADKRTQWKENVERMISAVSSHLKPASSSSGTATTQAPDLRTIVLLLAAATLVPSIGQVVASSRIQNQIEKEHADTKLLVERYLPAPTAPSSSPPASPVVLTQTNTETSSIVVERLISPASGTGATVVEHEPITINNLPAPAKPDPPPVGKPASGGLVQARFADLDLKPDEEKHQTSQCVTLHYHSAITRSFDLSFTRYAKAPWPPAVIQIAITEVKNCPTKASETLEPKVSDSAPASNPCPDTAFFTNSASAYNACLHADVSIEALGRKHTVQFWQKRAITIDIRPRDLTP